MSKDDDYCTVKGHQWINERTHRHCHWCGLIQEMSEKTKKKIILLEEQRVAIYQKASAIHSQILKLMFQEKYDDA